MTIKGREGVVEQDEHNKKHQTYAFRLQEPLHTHIRDLGSETLPD
jgi:hypothetical protein